MKQPFIKQIAFHLLIQVIFSQQIMAQPIKNVVDAENAFAKTAVDLSVRTAFLQHMDSTAVVFENGEAFNGIKQWQNTPDFKEKLLWRPVFFAMAASGELGFTTGPYELRKTLKDSAVSAGQYSTVWKKNSNGEWKFLIDLGTTYSQSEFKQQEAEPFTALGITPSNETSIHLIETKFIADFNTNSLAAYRKNIQQNSWFNLYGIPPLRDSAQTIKILSEKYLKGTFTILGEGISASKDIAYVYGNYNSYSQKKNYLRIWAHTANGWKILLQVIA